MGRGWLSISCLARGALGPMGGCRSEVACRKLSLSAATHGKGVQGHFPTVLFLHHSPCLSLEVEGCKPLLQGHWTLQIWTRTRERSFKPLLGICHICVQPTGLAIPQPLLFDFLFWVTTCQAPRFGVNPTASDRRAAKWTLLGGVSLTWLGLAGRERAWIWECEQSSDYQLFEPEELGAWRTGQRADTPQDAAREA